MLNTFYKTVFERSFARLWAQADGTGESMMVFFGEPIQTNLGAAKRTGRSPCIYIRLNNISLNLGDQDYSLEKKLRNSQKHLNIFHEK
jgi:hypothetical protein